VARAEAYLRAKFRLDLSNRLATITNVTDRTGQADRQRSGSIERTVLQTVTQKWPWAGGEQCRFAGRHRDDSVSIIGCKALITYKTAVFLWIRASLAQIILLLPVLQLR